MRLAFAILALAMVLAAGCGGEDAASTSAQAEVAANNGATVTLKEASVVIPSGVLSADTTVSIERRAALPAELPSLDGVQAAGEAYRIDIGQAALAGVVTLEIPYDPSALPADTPEDMVFLAYYDEPSGVWIPVGGRVDAERHVIIVDTDHLSWWNPFTWDWDATTWNWEAWIAVLSKTLSFSVTDWAEGLSLLTEPCHESTDHVAADNSEANLVIQGCIDEDDASSPSLRVLNLKSFDIDVSPAAGGPGYPPRTILGPGESVRFEANTSDRSPLTVYADFSQEAMWRFVVRLCLKMMPAGHLVPDEGIGHIANRIADVSSLGESNLELLLGDGLAAAEAIVHQMYEEDFQRAFAEAAAEYGQQHNLEWMSKWTFENVRNVFIGVASVNVIISATDFLANYFFNNRSAVAFNWATSKPSPTPLTPQPTVPIATTPSPETTAPLSEEAAAFALGSCHLDFADAGFVDAGDGILVGHTDLMIFPDPGTPYPAEDAQVRDVRVTRVDSNVISETDRLNNIEWDGDAHVEYRQRTRRIGRDWGLWEDESAVIDIQKISGQWERIPRLYAESRCLPR